MFFIGKCMVVVGNRELLSDVRVGINYVGNNNEDFYPIAKLARAHNNTGFEQLDPNTWVIKKVFVERIAIVADSSKMSQIQNVFVNMDSKSFHYDRNELLDKWEIINPIEFGPVTVNQNSVLLLSPRNLFLERSNIPIKQDFFESLINWRGDNYFVKKDVVGQAAKSSLIFSVWFFVCYIVYLYYFKKQSLLTGSQDTPQDQYNAIFIYLVLILGIIFEFTLIYLIKIFYHPDILSIINKAKELYLDFAIISFIPKPVEQRQFLLGVILSPFFLLLSYYLLSKFAKRLLKFKINVINRLLIFVTIFLIPTILYLALSITDFFYIGGSLVSSVIGFVVYAFIIFPILLTLIFNGKYKHYLVIFLSIELALVLLCTVFLSISWPTDSNAANHILPVYFPQTQIAFGKAIVQQVPSLYGMFPIFLKPIFDIIGSGVINFTAVMGVLILLSISSLFFFLKSCSEDKILPFLGVISVLEYSHYSPLFIGGWYVQYYQYLPIRVLFPALILLVISKYLNNQNKLWYFIGHLVAIVGLFWNLDSGVVVFISWVLFLIYLEAHKLLGQRLSKIILSVSKHLLISFGFLLASGLLLSVYYISHTGNLPDINLFFQYSKLFYSGWFLIPLPIFPHIWHFLVLIYFLSLLISLVYLIKNTKNKKGPIYFVLSIMGFGLFSYFEGRSHNSSLIGPSFIAILILTIFLDDLFIQFRDNFKQGVQVPILKYFFIIVLSFVLVLPAVDMVYNAGYFIDNVPKAYLGVVYPSNKILAENINFLKFHTVPGDRVIILDKYYDGIYYGESHTVCAIDLPSASDMLFKYQSDMLLNFLNSDNHTKFFVGYDYDNPLVLKILNLKYKKIISDTGMMMFVK